MNDDSNDPIIDALLEEVLGGQTPPDLTEKILRKYQAGSEPHEDMPAGQPEVVISTMRRGDTSRRRNSDSVRFMTAAAIVLIAAGLFGTWAWRQSQDIADSQPKAFEPTPEQIEKLRKAPTASTPIIADNNSTERKTIAEEHPWVNQDMHNQTMIEVAQTKKQKAAAEAEALRKQKEAEWQEIAIAETPEYQRGFELGRPKGNSTVLAMINDQLRDDWASNQVANPAAATNKDRVWFRRATYVLLGRQPTEDEQRQFDASFDKEAALDALLQHELFVSNWATKFADVLVGDVAPSDQFDRSELEGYLADALRDEKPYDQLAFELITAEGVARSDDGAAKDGYNPAVNFLLAHASNGGAQAATDRVCQVFLGKRMQCVRCHDHPSSQVELPQKRYWEVASFFAQMQSTNRAGFPLLINQDYAGSDGNSPDEADLFYETANKLGAAAYPVDWQGKSLETKSGRVSDVNRRVALAHSIVSSDDFAQAAVNRMWKSVFRIGFTQPIDDMGEHNPAPQKELLNKVAKEFRNSEFDMRKALRWMLRSDAFDRKVAPRTGPTPAFSTFARQEWLSYPDIGPAVRQLANARAAKQSFDPTVQLANVGAAAESKLTREQKMAIIRGAAARHRNHLLSMEADGLLVRLAKNQKLSNKQRVEHLFFSLIGRAPYNQELRSGVKLLDDSPSATTKSLQEIGWIIINSSEFKSNH